MDDKVKAKRFGDKVRRLRMKKEISLRKFAVQVNMSPTYLSKVERGDLNPPGEGKVIAIARELGEDPDILLALADRVSSDLPRIIKKKPREVANFLRTIKDLSKEELIELTDKINRRNRRS